MRPRTLAAGVGTADSGDLPLMSRNRAMTMQRRVTICAMSGIGCKADVLDSAAPMFFIQSASDVFQMSSLDS
jgi:hypothetical protein